MDRPKIVIITGPTASGKSRLAVELAGLLSGEIVSADSMQVYRYMDIGTAKPTVEERRDIPHYMIDILNPDEEFNAGIYREMAIKVIDKLCMDGKMVLVVGGTGLYIRTLIRGLIDTPAKDAELRKNLEEEIENSGTVTLYKRLKELDPAAASTIHPNDGVRIIRAIEVYYQTNVALSLLQKRHGFMDRAYDALIIGVSVGRDELYRRIEKRVDRMVEMGIVNEVEDLFDRGYGPELKPMQALGYKEIAQYILGRVGFSDALRLFKRNTRRYAKRQITWFKKEDDINWLSDRDEMINLIERFYN